LRRLEGPLELAVALIFHGAAVNYAGTYAAAEPEVRVIRLRRNFGKGAALMAGLWADVIGAGRLAEEPAAVFSLANWREVMLAKKDLSLVLAVSGAVSLTLAVGCGVLFSRVPLGRLVRAALVGKRRVKPCTFYPTFPDQRRQPHAEVAVAVPVAPGGVEAKLLEVGLLAVQPGDADHHSDKEFTKLEQALMVNARPHRVALGVVRLQLCYG